MKYKTQEQIDDEQFELMIEQEDINNMRFKEMRVIDEDYNKAFTKVRINNGGWFKC